MARQCLYCAKELPKNSTSNFCSKECWTEYKKLKAMNVDADKQATVLLRRTDIPQQPEPQPAQTTPEPTPQPVEQQADSVHDEFNNRLKSLEDSIHSEIAELKEHLASLSQSRGSSHESSPDQKDFEKRLSHLEAEIEKFEPMIRLADKLEERIINLEKKIRQLSTGGSEPKKGFWGRLFG